MKPMRMAIEISEKWGGVWKEQLYKNRHKTQENPLKLPPTGVGNFEKCLFSETCKICSAWYGANNLSERRSDQGKQNILT